MSSKTTAAKQALVTGGAGAIGINLVHRLIKEGYQVTVFSLPAPDLVRLKNLGKKVRLVKGDVLDATAIKDTVKRVKPNLVFHLASTSWATSPQKHIEVNCIGTINLLEALREQKPERFVYTGSAAGYGSGNNLKENSPFTPNTIFGAAKAATSTIVRTYAEVYGLPTVELRFFLPYGPWEHPARLIPNIILSALKGKDLSLTSGTQERDPTYIDDIIDALMLAATKNVADGSILNIGSGVGVPVKEIVTETLDLMGNPVKPFFGAVPMRENEIMKMSGNISLARQKLGWRPKHTLRQGLKKTIDWWKSNLDFAEANLADYMTRGDKK